MARWITKATISLNYNSGPLRSNNKSDIIYSDDFILTYSL